MSHSDLALNFQRIDNLVSEMNNFAPNTTKGISDFRADLAGMLVVTIAAMYETCAKETMVSYAGKHNAAFEDFTANNFSRLSSRIRLNDLRNYCQNFSPQIRNNFDVLFKRRKSQVRKVTGKNIESEFENMLKWRHDFAHAGIRNTTIEEAIKTHRLARIVMLTFHDSFH